MVKAAVEKDWGAEVPPAFKIMYSRPAPTRAVQPPLNISQCVAALALRYRQKWPRYVNEIQPFIYSAHAFASRVMLSGTNRTTATGKV